MSGVQLFSSKNFFVLQRVPSRTRFIEDIERHGGRLVKSESQADYIIADHMRRDAPPGSLSYRFVEAAIAADAIPDASAHLVGGAQRGPGVRLVPTTGGLRTPFTAEDDRVLWRWVAARVAEGQRAGGNEIYKELERVNPRHTYQSWRARYVKTLEGRPPAGVDAESGPAGTAGGAPGGVSAALLTPPLEPVQNVTLLAGGNAAPTRPVMEARGTGPRGTAPGAGAQSGGKVDYRAGFTGEDLEAVLSEAEHIEDIPFCNWDSAWSEWAKANGKTAKEWETLYKHVARPIYLERKAKREAKKSHHQENGSSIAQFDGAVSSRPARDEAHRNAVVADRVEANVKVGRSPEKPMPSPERERNTQASIERLEEVASLPLLSEEIKKRSRDSRAWTPFKRPRVEALVDGILAPRASLPSHQEKATDAKALAASSSKAHDPAHAGSVRAEPPAQRNIIVPEAPVATPDQPVSTAVTENALPPGQPHRLTEENLARAQASHRRASHKRATDLLEDEQDQDQSGFADYLQSILSPDPGAATGPETPPNGSRKVHLKEIAETDPDASENDFGDVRSEPPSEELHSPVKTSGRPISRYDSDLAAEQAAQQLRDETARHLALGHDSRRDLLARQSPVRPQRRGIHSGLSSSPPAPSFHYGSDDHDEEPVAQSIELDFAGLPADGDVSSLVSSQSDDLPELNLDKILGGNPSLKRRMETETQAIFEANTQAIDLSFPLPPSDQFLRSSSEMAERPHRRQSGYLRKASRSPTPDTSDVESINEWIDNEVKNGADENQVLDALEATCMQPDLAKTALEFLALGKGLPQTIAGIWTEEDDVALVATDPDVIAVVEMKHGLRGMEKRSDFLSQLRE